MNSSAYDLHDDLRILSAVASDDQSDVKTLLGVISGSLSQHRTVVSLATILVILALYSAITGGSKPVVKGAPKVGHRSFLEPALLVRLRYLTQASKIIRDGFAKNVSGPYTWATLFLKTESHKHVLRQHLTPHLDEFVSLAGKELDHGFANDVKVGTEYENVNLQYYTSRLVARMSSKIFVGNPTCRNDRWLSITVLFTFYFFVTVLSMRMVPMALRPFVAPFLPQRWLLYGIMKKARKIILPVIEEYQDKLNLEKSKDETTEETFHQHMMGWLIEHAQGDECDPENLTQRLLVMTLASVHTTSLSCANCIYDLLEHPELIEPLREEISQFWHGGEITLQDIKKMHVLDSFLEENQRMHPALSISSQRMAMEDIKLRDGTQIPSGAMIGFPSWAVATDPRIYPSPDTFDAYRALRKRQATDNEGAHGSEAVTREKLVFGYGKGACPGRFFANAEIKMLLIHFLMEFDFEMPKGAKRPDVIAIDEFNMLDPRGRIMLRRRAGVGN